MSDEREKQWVREWSELGYCETSSKFAYIDACKKRQEECDRLRANHEEFARKMGNEIHVRNNHVRELKTSNEQLRAENEKLKEECDELREAKARLKDLAKRAKEHIEKGYFEDHNDWYKWLKDSEVISE